MGAIQGQVNLLVTPEELNAKAGEVETCVGRMRDKFNNIHTLVKKSSAYWLGEAGDIHRKNYEDQVEDIDTILKRLGDHPGNLRTIAQTYTQAELKVEATISELPGDVL